MKTFTFNIVRSSQSLNGGRNQTAAVYAVKNNTPIFLLEEKWNTVAHGNAVNMVRRVLVDHGFIPEKFHSINSENRAVYQERFRILDTTYEPL